MRRYFLTIICSVIAIHAISQNNEPVKWEAFAEKKSASEFYIYIKAEIDQGWYLYSQFLPEGGPIPTKFDFKGNEKDYKLISTVVEEQGYEEFDELFELKIKFFKKKAIFKQRIELLSKKRIEIPVSVTFMTCNGKICLPPKTIKLLATIENKNE